MLADLRKLVSRPKGESEPLVKTESPKNAQDVAQILMQSATGRDLLREMQEETQVETGESRATVAAEIERLEVELAQAEQDYDVRSKELIAARDAAEAARLEAHIAHDAYINSERGRLASMRTTIRARRAALTASASPKVVRFLADSEQGLDKLRAGAAWRGVSLQGLSVSSQNHLLKKIRETREVVATLAQRPSIGEQEHELARLEQDLGDVYTRLTSH